MSEFVRAAITRLSRFIGNKNLLYRQWVRLPLSVSLTDAKTNNDRVQRQANIGYTCDLSKTGLSFTVRSIHLGGRHLFYDRESTLQIGIDLPNGSININAIPVRFDLFNEGGKEPCFIVGVQIVGMSNFDRKRYDEFLGRRQHNSPGKVNSKTPGPASIVSKPG